MILIRSIIFNICFYTVTSIICMVFIPALLFPRGATLFVTRLWLSIVSFLEKHIVGLTFEVRGQQFLPKSGSYIVAAKHQSAYETLKLHHLFGDPTIVLKRELLKIPLFGTFLNKLDVIAINRGNKEEAMKSIVDGAKRMQDQERPIIIFPQGTRVSVSDTPHEKPYKGGIVKMYANTTMAIIPLALNSGLFWARNSFIKKPGKVIFEFLAPIESGLPDKKVMKALEDRIEEKTIELMNEAKSNYPYLRATPTPPLLSERTNETN